MSDESKMSFLEHLQELRVRVIRSVVAIFVGMFICWFFREQILSFLLAPLYTAWSQVDGLPEPKPLNFSSMLEPFVAYLKLSALGGIFVGSPIILLQIWRFVAPGLYRRERRLAGPFVIVSTLLFVFGSLFAYSMVFPIGFKFFLEFAAGREMTLLEAEVAVTAVENPARPVQEKAPEKVDARFVSQDAGLADASVNPPAGESAPAPPVSSATASDPTPESAADESWYEWLIGHIVKKQCGTLAAAALPEGASVQLGFSWHTARCGELPPLTSLRRDGRKLIVNWKSRNDFVPGHIGIEATDRPGAPGTYLYSLSVPTNPGTERLAPVLMIKDYLSFAMRLLIAFGLIFELPILIMFLSFAGIVNYKQLLGFSRWFLVISVVLGAMLTPPDVVTQILLAVPLMALYFISVLFAYLLGPKVDE